METNIYNQDVPNLGVDPGPVAGEVLHHDGCLQLHGGVQAAPAGQVQGSAALVILQREVSLVTDQDLDLRTEKSDRQPRQKQLAGSIITLGRSLLRT